MLLSCRYRLPSEAFPSMFATSSRCGRRRSGNRCRSISAVSWSASLHVPPSTRGCRVFANERKRRGRALDLPASCAPVTRIGRDRRRRCIRAGRGAGGLGPRRTVGGIHGHRGDIGCPRVGVGRVKQHSASIGTVRRNLSAGGEQRAPGSVAAGSGTIPLRTVRRARMGLAEQPDRLRRLVRGTGRSVGLPAGDP